ncbi:putative kinesin heavy chain [Operophtera brumata]|uniref:Putative kinesin heavy chain n=1 Tax=Operophtera brumata TaxID=104452 RepID=A0A0L7KUV2_OPEBR|nr:putative kinesin heavy chain [Operophtera brumata]
MNKYNLWDISFQVAELKNSIDAHSKNSEETVWSATQESTQAQREIQAVIANTVELGTRCIAAGTMNQEDSSLKSGHGLQCVVMSSCGFAYSVVKSQAVFTSMDIDNILCYGNNIYVNSVLRGTSARLIEPEELPTLLEVGNYKINVCRPEWKLNGLYASTRTLLNNSIDLLELNLNTIFANNEYASVNDGFLFTGQSATVSFWRHYNTDDETRSVHVTHPMRSNDVYYLFNSHAIDETGIRSIQNPNTNLARLFKVYGIRNLATLLLKNSVFDGREYSIHHIRVESFEELHVMPLIGNTLNREQNLYSKLATSKPIALIEKMPQNEKQTSKNIGRPKKVKRGPLKQSQNAHLTASIKYNASNPTVNRQAVKRYTESNPTANRQAVKRYTESNPTVHRQAVQRYTESNPTVHRQAVKRYTESNPTVHRQAVKRYTESNPTVHREAVSQYHHSHPEISRETTARYRDTRREQIREANVDYNLTQRGVEPELRRIGLIGEKSDDELNPVQLYSLKKTCLDAEGIFHCTHCNANLFEEEKARKQWCCGLFDEAVTQSVVADGTIDASCIVTVDMETPYTEEYEVSTIESYSANTQEEQTDNVGRVVPNVLLQASMPQQAAMPLQVPSEIRVEDGARSRNANLGSSNRSMAVRVRPGNDRTQPIIVDVIDDKTIIFVRQLYCQGAYQPNTTKQNYLKRTNTDLKFVFDNVCGQSATNKDVFEITTKEMLGSLMEGYNCSVFTYGATGAGKTFTMIGNSEDPGITHLTMEHLFYIMDTYGTEREFDIDVSYLEVSFILICLWYLA